MRISLKFPFHLLLIMFFIGYTQVGQVSAQWTAAERNSFFNEMKDVPELDAFGERKQDWINCYLEKLEQNYASFAAANQDEIGVPRLAEECTRYVYSQNPNSGARGNRNDGSITITPKQEYYNQYNSTDKRWSDAERSRFIKELLDVPELDNFGDQKMDWIYCFLAKCEINYPSYEIMDRDEEGVTKLGAECYGLLFSSDSQRGNWSEADKQLFIQTMNNVPELDNFGQFKSAFINCMLQKCEMTYGSFMEADTDERGITRIAEQCAGEIGG